MDSFTITILFIVASATVGAFFRRRTRDKCLRTFENDTVTYVPKTDGKQIKGVMRLESTGFELEYPPSAQDEHGSSSFIIYKEEYGKFLWLARYHDELSEKGKRDRDKDLRKTYRPWFGRRLKRHIINMFKTVRDSVGEILNVVLSAARKTRGVGVVLTSGDKYVTQMQSEVFAAVGTSFEPLLEKHIGQRVIVEAAQNDAAILLTGVLKDYTSGFLSIMDIENTEQGWGPDGRDVDVVIARQIATVRGLAD
ncbi:hypothetical protein STSP2_00829 [Anaerohalosphaera lusitana]|uniref:Uncharacterized protein n=1 Tax=Anaerohalosphaera lusitana TaxID=1936003 RepID=A0A1U9NIE2_9BACT|nr:hypothetical protein [Anaerohalosphaera lusitana]AQT67681.1 hypothetical protein STSP2_00829 [Anaerohalosphaera lusitana]